jgi:hypothetical protein
VNEAEDSAATVEGESCRTLTNRIVLPSTAALSFSTLERQQRELEVQVLTNCEEIPPSGDRLLRSVP